MSPVFTVPVDTVIVAL